MEDAPHTTPSDPGRPAALGDGGNLVKNAKRSLGLGNDAGKELDDEKSRPPEDRSPLTPG
jgi:hypothetical protein